MGSDGIAWPRLGHVRKKVQVSFGQSEFCQVIACPEAIYSPNIDCLARYRAAKHINQSTGIILLPFRAAMLEVQQEHSTVLDKELS